MRVRALVLLSIAMLPDFAEAAEATTASFDWLGLSSVLLAGVLGAFAGSIGAYWGPKKLEEARENKLEKTLNGPRKRLLKDMLSDPKFNGGRSLKTLRIATGTHEDECRRLLIEIQARGLILGNGQEGWALIERNPINEQ